MTLPYLIGYTCVSWSCWVSRTDMYFQMHVTTTASAYASGGFLLSNRYKTRRYLAVSSLRYAVPFRLTKGGNHEIHDYLQIV